MSGVDVLAVIDLLLDDTAIRQADCAERGQKLTANVYELRLAEGKQARAAVAKLMEAAAELVEDQVYSDWDEPDYEDETGPASIARNKGQRIYWQAVAALARCGAAK